MIRDNEVFQSVPVEIGSREVDRIIAGGNRCGDLEVTVTATVQDNYQPLPANHQVDVTVPIYVIRQDRTGLDADIDLNPVERALTDLLSL